jgi:hypothetical protein
MSKHLDMEPEMAILCLKQVRKDAESRALFALKLLLATKSSVHKVATELEDKTQSGDSNTHTRNLRCQRLYCYWPLGPEQIMKWGDRWKRDVMTIKTGD